MLNEDTLEPRPDYWAALLWKRSMGNVVLDPGVKKDQTLRVFAQCSRGENGGVAMLAVNTDTQQDRELMLPSNAEQFTLTASELTSTKVMLNGLELKAEPDGSVVKFKGKQIKKGANYLPASSITFLIIPSARNTACM